MQIPRHKLCRRGLMTCFITRFITRFITCFAALRNRRTQTLAVHPQQPGLRALGDVVVAQVGHRPPADFNALRASQQLQWPLVVRGVAQHRQRQRLCQQPVGVQGVVCF